MKIRFVLYNGIFEGEAPYEYKQKLQAAILELYPTANVEIETSPNPKDNFGAFVKNAGENDAKMVKFIVDDIEDNLWQQEICSK